MVFQLLVSVLFEDPLPSILWWEVLVSGEELKWRQLTHNQLMSPQGPHFSAHSTAKTKDKSTNLRKNGIYWYKLCCDRFSILVENPKLLIMNKLQETSFFHGCQKLTSAMKLRLEK